MWRPCLGSGAHGPRCPFWLPNVRLEVPGSILPESRIFRSSLHVLVIVVIDDLASGHDSIQTWPESFLFHFWSFQLITGKAL